MPEPPKPLQTRRSCDYCLGRKVRCDGTRPCQRCVARSGHCVYGTITRKPPSSTARRSRAEVALQRSQTLVTSMPPQTVEALTHRSHVVAQELTVLRGLRQVLLRVNRGTVLASADHHASALHWPLIPVISHQPAMLDQLVAADPERSLEAQVLRMLSRRTSLLATAPELATMEETLYHPLLVLRLTHAFVQMCYAANSARFFPRFLSRLSRNQVSPLLLNTMLAHAVPFCPDVAGNPKTLQARYYLERVRTLVLADSEHPTLHSLTDQCVCVQILLSHGDTATVHEVLGRILRNLVGAGFHQLDLPTVHPATVHAAPIPTGSPIHTTPTLYRTLVRQLFWVAFCGKTLANLMLSLVPDLEPDMISVFPPDSQSVHDALLPTGQDPCPALPFPHFDFTFGTAEGITLCTIGSQVARHRAQQRLGQSVTPATVAILNRQLLNWRQGLPISCQPTALLSVPAQTNSACPDQAAMRLASLHGTYTMLVLAVNSALLTTPATPTDLLVCDIDPQALMRNAAESMTQYVLPVYEHVDFRFHNRSAYSLYFGPITFYCSLAATSPARLRPYYHSTAQRYIKLFDRCAEHYPMAQMVYRTLQPLVQRIRASYPTASSTHSTSSESPG
ncbi:hypothetical protein H4R34_000288 [Dimargaris verticillata]|uniref:Zn(2)-C6 fungal-type domain-containing protein n=1 Tax=Dimargaris verticillata TaxID=2761393 RepID=A0A9W8EC10_9FUNG|nr:hypothetical protein H4R34_000288 [Dimargaris verticillata]